MKKQATRFISLLLFVFCCKVSIGQYSRLSFHKLSIEDGLSQSFVQSIVQDKYGFIWFGTQDGLNQYNNYSFKVFRKSDGLTGDAIKALLIVNDTLLWIGTRGTGIDIMNLKTYKIVKHINTSNSNINSNVINDLKLDKKNQVWVATDNGINVITYKYQITSLFKGTNNVREHINCIEFDKEADRAWFSTEFSGVFSIQNNKVTRHNLLNTKPLKSFDNLILDNHGTVWVCSNNGLFYKKRNDTYFSEKVIAGYSDSKFHVHHIFKDKSGYLWFSALTAGLFRLDPITGKAETYSERNQSTNKFDMICNVSSCIDQSGLIWIGTNGYGVQYFQPKASFKTISYDIHSPFRTSGKSIRRIAGYHGDSNLIWIGSYSGLDLFDKNKGHVINYNTANAQNIGMNCDAIYDIYHSKTTNHVILGTEGKGLLLLNLKTQRFFTPILPKNVPEVVLTFKLLKGESDDVWVGCNKGLYLYNEKSNVIKPAYIASREKENFAIYDIDMIGNLLLLSTKSGLYVFNRENNTCTNVSLKLNQISEPHINSILVDSNVLWVATKGSGLIKYNYQVLNNKLIILNQRYHYSVATGFPNDIAYGALKDHNKELWVSTNNGLAKINPETHVVSTFNYNDGLQGNEFNGNSYFKDEQGFMFFGGINGLSYFNPTTLYSNKKKPTISFTSFDIFNAPVDTNFNLNEIEELAIKYSDNVITFSFASSDYTSQKRLQYAYQLKGFSNKVIQLGHTNTVTFTNLDPGEYELKIIGSNSDGVWNEEGRTLRIRIIPPFWRTNWFYAIIVLLILIAVYLTISLRTRNIRLANLKLEKMVTQRTNEIVEKNRELAMAKDIAEKSTKAKSEFLATMSHEIRTPMNGVVGMVSLLEHASLTKEQKGFIDIIKASTDNLLQVINDILDFSKIESGKLELHIEDIDLHKVILNSVELFNPKANEKGLELMCYIHPNVPAYIQTDESRLKQILYNLINNAVKFTPAGHVYVEVNVKEQQANSAELIFKIIDTGIGIAKDKQHTIFEVFTQADGSTSRKYGGTGLGLSVCQNLVTLLQGTITVESTVNEGSTFCFTLKCEIPEQHQTTSSIECVKKNVLLHFLNPLNNEIATKYLTHLNNITGKNCITINHISLNSQLLQAINNNNIDVILTDQFTALELTRRLQVKNLQIGYFGNTQIPQTISSKHLVQKPITFDKIRALLVDSINNETELPELTTLDLTPLNEKYPLNILIAEDNLINQNIFKRMLKLLGYEVYIAANGLSAYQQVINNNYDLVFMDIHMPEMDGIEATQKIIAEMKQRAPIIIALTASVITEEINLYKQAGMKDVLAKPLTLEDAKSCLLKWGKEISLSKKH